MRLSQVSALGALAVLCAIGRDAQAFPDPKASRRSVFWNPAESIWTGELPAQACAVGRVIRTSQRASPALRSGSYHRSGELIAEIRAPARLAAGVTLTAQSCAREALAAVSTAKLLLHGAAGWSTFSLAFEACLQRSNAQPYVGSMTLWIDHDCVL